MATKHVIPGGGGDATTFAGGLALLSGGDVLYLHGGTYNERVNGISFPSGSSWSSPTRIAAYPGDTVVIKPTSQQGVPVIGFNNGAGKSYIIFDGLILDGTNVLHDYTFSVGTFNNHIRAINCTVRFSGAVEFPTNSGNGMGLSGNFIEIINCDIHDNGLSAGDSGSAGYGIYIGSGTDLLIENCRVHDNGGWGIHLNANSNVDMSLSDVPDHYFQRALIKNNEIYANCQVATQSSGGLLLGGFSSDIECFGNVVHDQVGTGGGIETNFFRTVTRVKIFNNTVTKNSRAGIDIASAVDAQVKNNICADNNLSNAGFVNLDISQAGSGAVLSNNLCYGTGGTANGDITTNPFFLSGSDFHLGVGSPAIDAGADLFADGVDIDIEGTPRPVATFFDIGAYEYFDLSQVNPFEAPGTAHGTSTAVAVGRAVAPQGAGTAAGTSTVSGIGQFVSRQGAGSAAGVATVAGRSQVPPLSPTENPKTYTIRIREARIGANGVIEFEGVREDISVYDQVAQYPLLGALVQSGSPAPTPTPTQDDQSDNSRPGSTRLVLLDVPQLRAVDTGPGFYAAATGTSPGWNGAVLHEQIGADWVQIAELGQRAAIGQATTKLLTGPVTDFDETGRTYVFDDTHTVDVTLIDTESTLSSVSDGDLEVGVNAAAIGQHGRWEIISFGTATQLSERSWRLSHLLRGLKGTEWAIGLHMAGDTFVLLNESLRRVSDNWSELDTARSFRGVSIGTLLEDASTQVFTDTGISVKPLSPVFIRGEEDANENRTLRAYVRSRYDGLAGRDGVDPPPLDEPNLVMEWDIRNALGTTVLRTIRTTTESAAYTAAQQTDDFGSVPASLNVCVYQISPNRGRGYSGCAVISSFDTADVPTELVALVVEELDGDPSVPNVSRIQFDGLIVTPGAAGVAIISSDGAGLADAVEAVFDGNGHVLTTGIKLDLEVPFACVITRATLLADQSGSIVVDVWKDTYANYPPTGGDSITASAKPTISSATKSQDSTLSGWTTSVSAGDILRFNIDSITTITRATLSLKISRT